MPESLYCLGLPMSILYLFGIARCERYPGTLLKHSFFLSRWIWEFIPSSLCRFNFDVFHGCVFGYFSCDGPILCKYAGSKQSSTSGLQQACDMDSVENKRTEVLLCWFHFLWCRPGQTQNWNELKSSTWQKESTAFPNFLWRPVRICSQSAWKASQACAAVVSLLS